MRLEIGSFLGIIGILTLGFGLFGLGVVTLSWLFAGIGVLAQQFGVGTALFTVTTVGALITIIGYAIVPGRKQ